MPLRNPLFGLADRDTNRNHLLPRYSLLYKFFHKVLMSNDISVKFGLRKKRNAGVIRHHEDGGNFRKIEFFQQESLSLESGYSLGREKPV